MPVMNSIADHHDTLTRYRRELHQNPQTAFEETYISDFVGGRLKDWGISFERGFAKTGIVAKIEGQSTSSGKTIGLRADMDALDILEKNGLPHASKIPGKMHACGHDGHTVSLLGAAKYLQETKNFNGTVHLIFQPAEEGTRGARIMIQEGLFEKYPCDFVFGYHNWPDMPAGQIGMRVGGIFAASSEFKIFIEGKGGHAAKPNLTNDPGIVAAQIMLAAQTIVSRNIDPHDQAVVSITNMNVGRGPFNVIDDKATLSGTIRTFQNETLSLIKKRLEDLSQNIAAGFGAEASIEFLLESESAAVINTETGVAMAQKAAEKTIGAENIDMNVTPFMGGEDFSAYLMEREGAFVMVGQGTPDENSPHNQMLHHPCYDFNDEIIPIVSSYFANLVEDYMPLEQA